MQGHDIARGGILGWTLQRDPPRRSVRLHAAAAQFAADLDQVGRDARSLDGARNEVHRISLGDAADIERHAAWLTQGAGGGIDLESLPADTLSSRGNCLIGRRSVMGCRHGTEPPQIDQRTDRRIESAIGGGGGRQRTFQHGAECHRQIQRNAGRQAVEPAEIGVGAPSAHLSIHLVEPPLDLRAQPDR